MNKVYQPHYYHPDTLGDKCQWCDKPEHERPHVALPSKWRPVLAMLSHNTEGFRPVEITEYTQFDQQLNGTNVVRALLGTGYAVQVGPPSMGRFRAIYRLTPRGWAWVEGRTAPGPLVGPPSPAAPEVSRRPS